MPSSLRTMLWRVALPLVILMSVAFGYLGGLAAVRQYRTPPSLSQEGRARESDQTLISPPRVLSVERAEERGTIEGVKKVTPAVVSIIITKDVARREQFGGELSPFDDFFGFGFPQELFPFRRVRPPTGGQDGTQRKEVGGGTGFLIRQDGLIITNKHVVSEGQAEYTVITNDGKKYPAKVMARDPLNDFAVVKIEATELPVVELGDSGNLQIGQTVIAIGNTLSQYRNTVTKGVISGIGRRVVAGSSNGETEVLEEAIQTDAAINPGNSGGPLIDLDGRVIGINTAINREGQLVGFAIPINAVKSAIVSVEQHGRIIRPWLGVRYMLIDSEYASANKIDVDYGALIVRGDRKEDRAVIPDSPAQRAGLQEDDIILEVDGTRVTPERPLSNLISKVRPGDTVKLLVRSKGVNRTVAVTIGEFKTEEAR